MINKVYLLVLSLSLGVLSVSMAQSDCQVKKLGIEEKYEGECKKGLAHGEGTATGEDSYKGTFKKGYPDGYGEYLWSNGDLYKGHWVKGLKDGEGELKMIRDGKDSVLTGFWSDDEYIGKYKSPYEIVSKSPEMVSVSFSRKGDGNELLVMITTGRVPTDVTGLNVTNAYGNGVIVNRSYAFRDMVYPWQGSIRFAYNDRGEKQQELVAKINSPGIWEVRIDLRYTR